MPPKNVNPALGRRIAKARQAKGWSLREAAEQIGVDWSYLAKIEKGEYIAPKNLDRIARGFSIPISELRALATKGNLPALRPYLRAKYGLGEEAVAELEEHFKRLRKRGRDG